MLSGFEYPTFLVTLDGRLAALNSAATLEYCDLDVGDKIDKLPFLFDQSKNISTVISESLRSEDTGSSEVILKRAYGVDSERDATIAVTPSMGAVPTALVFVITTRWKLRSVQLLRLQFGLTGAETDVLSSFIDGHSSKDIARMRSRSHTTIKTQLQSILHKTGAHTKTELLRITLSLSDFVKDIGEITDAVTHPYRRQAEVLREGGRRIELTLMGAFDGSPILSVATAGFYTVNAHLEKAMFEEGMCLISVCPPGCGKTDVVPDGSSRLDTLAQDVKAVLDQLNIKRCTILATANNTPLCYSLVRSLPHRFAHAVQMSACVPLRYASSNPTQSQWVNGIQRACVKYPAMGAILLKGAGKAWATMGAKQFFRLQLSSNPVDAEIALKPENLAEYQHAIKTATTRGISDGVKDMTLSFGDWTDDIEATKIKITIFHGEQDKLFPIDGIRSFVNDHSDRVRLHTFPDAGFTFMYRYPIESTKLLKTVVERYQ